VLTRRVRAALLGLLASVLVACSPGGAREAVSGLAGDESGTIADSLLVPISSPGLALRLERADELVLETLLPWPGELSLAPPADEPRRDVCLRLSVNAEALDGQTSAITLALAPGVCRG